MSSSAPGHTSASISDMKTATDLEFLKSLDGPALQRALEIIGYSTAQLRQNLFVPSVLDFRTGAYFVEIEAANGIEFGNIYLLETRFKRYIPSIPSHSPIS